MKELVFVDCETTGIDPGDDAGEIVELALVDEIGTVLFDRKILPTHLETAREEALEINGFDLEVWEKEAVLFADVAEEVFSIVDGKLLVGSHATFDTEFLKYEIRRSGIEADVDRISYHVIDVSSIIFHCLVPPLEKSSLFLACEYFGISSEGAHTALVDAQRAREVYLRLQKMKPNAQLPSAQSHREAKFLREGDRFSYPGSFKIYEAQSDAVPDSRIEGKVVLPVTDGGLRDRMLTRLDASLLCEVYNFPREN